jgi:myo-inositol 2-dehydrogenase/D-chiro-inositol 1-dehydrogenase
MSKVGIGVIGLGRMGRVYATHTARQIEGATLVAAADPSQAALNEFSAQVPGVQVHSDYHDLLNDPHIQGVIVASPTSTHPEVVIAAAQAGKAIFCEKPLALTLPATDQIAAAVQKAGVLLRRRLRRRQAQNRRRADRSAGDHSLHRA